MQIYFHENIDEFLSLIISLVGRHDRLTIVARGQSREIEIRGADSTDAQQIAMIALREMGVDLDTTEAGMGPEQEEI